MSDLASRTTAAAAAVAAVASGSASGPATASASFHSQLPHLQQHQHIAHGVQPDVGLYQHANSAPLSLFVSDASFAPSALSPVTNSPTGRPCTPPLSSSTAPPFSPYSAGTNEIEQEGELEFSDMCHSVGEGIGMHSLEASGLGLSEQESQERMKEEEDMVDEERIGDANEEQSCSEPSAAGDAEDAELTPAPTKKCVSGDGGSRKKRPSKKQSTLRQPMPSSFDSYRAGHKYPCTFPNCTKLFERRYNLSVHLRRHTGETPYTCEVPGCGKQFKWRSSMAHHNKTHERNGDIDYKLPIVQDKNKSSHYRRHAASRLAARQAAARLIEQQQQEPTGARRTPDAKAKAEDLAVYAAGAGKITSGPKKASKKRSSSGSSRNVSLAAKDEPTVESSSPYRAAMKAATSAAALSAADHMNADMINAGSPTPALTTPQVPKPLPAFSPATAAIAASTVFSQQTPTLLGTGIAPSLPAPFSLGTNAGIGFSALSSGATGSKDVGDPLFQAFGRPEAAGATSMAPTNVGSGSTHGTDAFSFAPPDQETAAEMMDDPAFDWSHGF